MNIENIHKAMQVMVDVMEDKRIFHMGYWVTDQFNDNEPNRPSCGTGGCFAGHLILNDLIPSLKVINTTNGPAIVDSLTLKQPDYNYEFSIPVAKFLGISDENAEILCTTSTPSNTWANFYDSCAIHRVTAHDVLKGLLILTKPNVNLKDYSISSISDKELDDYLKENVLQKQSKPATDILALTSKFLR